jgi:hypothetical protein
VAKAGDLLLQPQRSLQRHLLRPLDPSESDTEPCACRGVPCLAPHPNRSVALALLVAVRPLRGLHQTAISKMSNSLFTKRTSSFDMRLTREAMSSADHPHHLEPLHRSGAAFIVGKPRVG